MFVKIPPLAWVGAAAAGIMLAGGLGFVLLAWRSGRISVSSGLVDGRLLPCPSSPNCVSSEHGTDDAHRVEPLVLPQAADVEATRAALRTALSASGARALVVDEPAYLRATFRTPLLGFVDDVELRIDEAARVVHVRSASRVGHSDFGANRARVERLRSQFDAALKAPR